MANVTARQVTKTYGEGATQVPAIEEISMELPQGGFGACVGPSGCGKSTFLRLLAGLDEPTTGEIELGGVRPQTARAAHKIGVSFQDPGLLPWRSVAANIRLPLEVARRNEPTSFVDELISMVGLSDFTDARPGQLSGGMRQRVAIARALALRPEILLLDEPLGALDEITRGQMVEELQRVWMERPVTTFLVTHSISEALMLADEVMILSSRPCVVHARVEVPFARPRQPELADTPEFERLAALCRHELRDSHVSRTSAAQSQSQPATGPIFAHPE